MVSLGQASRTPWVAYRVKRSDRAVDDEGDGLRAPVEGVHLLLVYPRPQLRINLLENPNAPFETKVREDMEFAFQYRTRWRRFCAYTKGGPEVEKYPTRLLVQALMQGRL